MEENLVDEEPSLVLEDDDEEHSTDSSILSQTAGDDDANDRVATMIEYFTVLATDGSDEEALSLILDQINHNENGNVDAAVGNDLFSRSNSNLKKEMLRILSSRIPENERQKRLGDRILKKWLCSNNHYRSFMFFFERETCSYCCNGGRCAAVQYVIF